MSLLQKKAPSGGGFASYRPPCIRLEAKTMFIAVSEKILALQVQVALVLWECTLFLVDLSLCLWSNVLCSTSSKNVFGPGGKRIRMEKRKTGIHTFYELWLAHYCLSASDGLTDYLHTCTHTNYKESPLGNKYKVVFSLSSLPRHPCSGRGCWKPLWTICCYRHCQTASCMQYVQFWRQRG